MNRPYEKWQSSDIAMYATNTNAEPGYDETEVTVCQAPCEVITPAYASSAVRDQAPRFAHALAMAIIGVFFAVSFAIGYAMLAEGAWTTLNHIKINGSAYCGSC